MYCAFAKNTNSFNASVREIALNHEQKRHESRRVDKPKKSFTIGMVGRQAPHRNKTFANSNLPITTDNANADLEQPA